VRVGKDELQCSCCAEEECDVAQSMFLQVRVRGRVQVDCSTTWHHHEILWSPMTTGSWVGLENDMSKRPAVSLLNQGQWHSKSDKVSKVTIQHQFVI
jgi:hypothetical protein